MSMLIGSRQIAGQDVEMWQIAADVIELRRQGAEAEAYMGRCDAGHVDAIWAQAAERAQGPAPRDAAALASPAELQRWMRIQLDPNQAANFDRWAASMASAWPELAELPRAEGADHVKICYLWIRGFLTLDEVRAELAGQDSWADGPLFAFLPERIEQSRAAAEAEAQQAAALGDEIAAWAGCSFLLITDARHPDYNSPITNWRQAGPQHIEYRDGGIWARIHISQCRIHEAPAEAQPCAI